MGYSYSDLKRVEAKIQELNRLCAQCETLNSALREKHIEASDALRSAHKLISGDLAWVGADADSCADAIDRLRQESDTAQEQFRAGMNALHSALLDEVHRQQTQHSKIYRSLNTMEVIAGRVLD